MGLLWIKHHGMLSAVREINGRLLERTPVFLLSVSVIAWPTPTAAAAARSE